MKARTDAGDGHNQVETELEHTGICIICGHHMVREILGRALARELRAEVDPYTCCEDALCSDLDHDIYVVYDQFGKGRMNGPQGTKRLRVIRPDAYVLGVTHNPGFDKQFLRAGADTALVLGKHPVKRIVHVVRERIVTTLYPAEARSLKGEA